MSLVNLTVNGRAISANIEPRQHLGDFLRENLLLTATHLGCEHGVCGACTVLIDGAPARSCIAFPAALEGARITTLEGLADDPVAAELREAFTVEHGLQCGFCTPGMLMMARDIVLRRPGAGEEAIRHELAGNLCRCTGYVGIVRAVESVAARHAGAAPVVTRGTEVAPSAFVSPLTLPVAGTLVSKQAQDAVTPKAAPAASADISFETLHNPVRMTQHFEVPAPLGEVWNVFQQPEKVVACLPGARLTAPTDGRSFEAEMGVKLGPMAATFRGAGTIMADEATLSGIIRGQGVDGRSASRVRAELTYRLAPLQDGSATAVAVEIAYELKGPLAQMSRGTIARDLAGRLTEIFAANLAAALTGVPAASKPAALDGGALFLAMLKGFFLRLFRRG
ncbi:2Fe-2S iron-sulfur cluster-binding protein [Ancylobacter sp. 6x-1]|uniref:2Fe-2S iron-sulfur cluster-binding protein n=1 Tax=Ancylobacter crimeensis TaxID=2579147 RepID=A0ABT0DBG9_9HYPH|nr:2Fe-2S iron-sulfur cluster-binding protein [Ancylobacter crimeensis]MCK0197306.1 2Fe-2S iron-sulfur cluster-binding protein [Ancylobacter crimeensis]